MASASITQSQVNDFIASVVISIVNIVDIASINDKTQKLVFAELSDEIAKVISARQSPVDVVLTDKQKLKAEKEAEKAEKLRIKAEKAAEKERIKAEKKPRKLKKTSLRLTRSRKLKKTSLRLTRKPRKLRRTSLRLRRKPRRLLRNPLSSRNLLVSLMVVLMVC